MDKRIVAVKKRTRAKWRVYHKKSFNERTPDERDECCRRVNKRLRDVEYGYLYMLTWRGVKLKQDVLHLPDCPY